MSIDMSQFYQVFYEEVAENLEAMESQLLSLDLARPDFDQLNSIFRSAHSIKGSSSTFGFNDMTEVTHVLEALLDRIRKQELQITAVMVDAFLKAGDVLRSLLNAHRNNDVVDEGASLEIRERLTGLTHLPIAQFKVEPSTVSGVSDESGQVPEPAGVQTYQIQFANTPTAFPSKTHLENLLAEIAKQGTVHNQTVSSVKVALTLITTASEATLREIFSYFLEPPQLNIKLLVGGIEQPYGFFVAPEEIQAGKENAEGYGLFIAEETLKSDRENAQGFGFFIEPDEIQAAVEAAQGYGFFGEVEEQLQRPIPVIKPVDVEIQRRATDRPFVEAAADASIRVSVTKIDKLVNLVGELVITQAMMAETISKLDPVQHERVLNGLAQFERNTRDLQESIMSVRMIPINIIFSRFPRLVRDFATKFDKQVQLKTIGESTELDKGLIEKISDPLTHLVRNSLDHGIEFPEDRLAKGKHPQGTITLRAAHQGGSIVIVVADDGAGLSRERILFKAKEKGLAVSDDMSDSEVWQIIFAPGFSTATMVTDVSGRGVGMDVVKRNIESIGGRVDIQSAQGQGTTITIRLPLTLAILDGLSVAVGEQIYIVPLSFISESLQPKPNEIKEISGQGLVVHVRGEYVPVIALHQIFNIKTAITNPSEGILVLLEAEGKTIALFVDGLMGQHQVVIKSLETNYRKVPGVSGATIMGDGRVAMILDAGELLKLVQRQAFKSI
ncbi:MAG: chemotaxis protein CheA [Gallionella sp.]|nr:chemotaxis protein CheA [Gallionella sp.]